MVAAGPVRTILPPNQPSVRLRGARDPLDRDDFAQRFDQRAPERVR